MNEMIDIEDTRKKIYTQDTRDLLHDFCDAIAELQEWRDLCDEESRRDKSDDPPTTSDYQVAVEWRDKYMVAKVALETAKTQCQQYHNESQSRRALLDKQAREIGNLGRRNEDLKDETAKLRVDLYRAHKVSARLEQLYRDERATHLVQDCYGKIDCTWNDTQKAQTEERILAANKLE